MSWSTELSQRAAAANRLYRDCRLCEHRCAVDRVAGELGFCRAGIQPRVWRYWVDFAEERPLVPSLLVYLSGCDLRCDFCISEDSAFDPSRGRPLTAEWLETTLTWGLQRGARTLQWLGGEPTIHLPAILDVMVRSRQSLPVAWKSDFYGTPQVWQALDGMVDYYVADFKFGSDDCASRIAGVERYFEVVTRNLLDVHSRGRLLVRHLLLPGHQECCLRPILAWMQHYLPRVTLSLRDGYLPRWQASRHPELSRPLDHDEGRRAVELAERFGLTILQ